MKKFEYNVFSYGSFTIFHKDLFVFVVHLNFNIFLLAWSSKNNKSKYDNLQKVLS